MRKTRISFLLPLFILLSLEVALAGPASKTSKHNITSEKKAESPAAIPESAKARMAEMPRHIEEDKMADTTLVYRAIVERAELGEVPRSVLDSAQCIAVFSAVNTRTADNERTGSGAVSCRTGSGAWSSPAFIDISTRGLRPSMTAKSSDLILFIQSDNLAKRLKSGTFSIDKGSKVAVARKGTSLEPGDAEIVAYERSEGGPVGIIYSSPLLSKNDAMNANYYGVNTDFSSLIEGRIDIPLQRDARIFMSRLPGEHREIDELRDQ